MRCSGTMSMMTEDSIILDTDDSMEHDYVNNPYRMFHNIYYDDNDESSNV